MADTRHIELFANAHDLPEAERAAYLDRACGGDAGLRARVEQMLAADRRNREERFLDSLVTNTGGVNGGPARGGTADGTPPRADPAGELPELPRRHVVETLLRKRMLPGVVVGLLGFGLFFVKNLFDGTYAGAGPGRAPEEPLWPMPTVHAATVAVFGACALWLWRRGPAVRLWELRAVELTVTAASTAFFTLFQWNEWARSLRSFTASPHGPGGANLLDVTNDECALRWFALILCFGAYAPNTWRRWFAFTAAMFVIPLLITGWLCASARVPAGGLLLDLGIWLVIATLIAVSGPLGVTMLERERIEARRVGPYRLGRCLGRGSMGVVFFAEHWLHKGQFAVKLLAPGGEAAPADPERFLREVKTMASLTHLNIARAVDFGRTEDNIVYYSMEYLPGLSLKQLVDRYGPLPPARAVHLLKQICSALRNAHDQGVVHRDIKPANIMVCERGGVWDVVKVLDFGIARAFTNQLQSAMAAADRLGHLEGTPAYVSPEQANGDAPTPASDIYSLGATAYFMLTGLAPFRHGNPAAVLHAHLTESPVPPRQIRPEIPEDLQSIILRCLEKSPSGRFSDIGQVERALSACKCEDAWDTETATLWWRSEPRTAPVREDLVLPQGPQHAQGQAEGQGPGR